MCDTIKTKLLVKMKRNVIAVVLILLSLPTIGFAQSMRNFNSIDRGFIVGMKQGEKFTVTLPILDGSHYFEKPTYSGGTLVSTKIDDKKGHKNSIWTFQAEKPGQIQIYEKSTYGAADNQPKDPFFKMSIAIKTKK